MAKLVSTNPARNYEVLGAVDISSDKEIHAKVSAAHAAKLAWKEIEVKQRIEFLKPIYEDFKNRVEELALLETRETGRAITESRSIIDGHINKIKWFLDNAESALSDEITYEDDVVVHRIVYEPIGVAAVITPWNHPFGMFVW